MVLSNRTYARAEKCDKAFSPFPKGLVDVYKVNVGDREGALGYETIGLVELTDSLQERYTFRRNCSKSCVAPRIRNSLERS